MKYKMTDKEFLEAGHKYQVGDIVISEGEDIDVVGGHNLDHYNSIDLAKHNWYVVYAAALENDRNDRLDQYVQAALTGLCSITEAGISNIPDTAAKLGRETMKAVDNEQD